LALKPRINHQIKAAELRVVDESGANLGILKLGEALGRALDAGADLIEISPAANPPVAKIMDFGKFQYLENKKQKESRVKGKTHGGEMKGIQVKIGTGDHDLAIKAARASEFLRQGHRVRVELFLRGRAKYFDFKFLTERLERLLKLVSEDYRIADPPQKSHKGLTTIIERAK